MRGKLLAGWGLAAALLFVSGCFGPSGEPPVAAFLASPLQGEVPLRVSFDATLSYDPDGVITAYHWDFGDGEEAQGAVVTHTYRSEGDYQVMLTVTDSQGRSSQTTTEIQAGVSFPLDVLFWEVVDTYFGTAVEGRVRNIGERKIAQGRVAVQFYDPLGVLVLEASAFVVDLAPGQEADFAVNTSLLAEQFSQVVIYTEVVHQDLGPAG